MARQLDLVNAMLSTLGEAPLVELDEGHPFVASALSTIKASQDELLGRGWWFNTETRSLKPDPVSGFVYLPGDAIQLDTKTHRSLQPRGRRLYNTDTGSYVVTDSPIPIKMYTRVELEDLPAVFYALLSHDCKLRFQTAFDADPVKIELIQKEVQMATLYLKMEHTRCVKANIGRRPAMQVGLGNVGAWGNPSRLPMR